MDSNTLMPLRKYGLLSQDWDSIIKVFARHSKIEKVFLFGSRAKGTYTPGSDIDLAYHATSLSYSDTLALYDNIDELGFLYSIDLININTLNDKTLLAKIAETGVIVYDRASSTT